MKNGPAGRLRLIAGLGSLVLMLGILTVLYYGMPQVPRAPRPAAPARTGAVAPRAAGASASRVVTTSYAATVSAYQFCYYNGGFACLNAWGGGPWVNVYTGGPSSTDKNADFQLSFYNGYTEIKFNGGGSWNGKCIGDAYNDPGYADTSLDTCGSASSTAGWGTYFTTGTSGCPNNESWFYNVHWKGYLGPPNNWVNGSHFYLNNKGYACFSILVVNVNQAHTVSKH